MYATLPVGDMNPRGRVDLLGGRLGRLPDGPRWRLRGDRLGTSGLGARGAATARGKGKNRGEPGHRRKSTVSHRATLTCCMCAKWCSRIRVDTSSRANVRRHSTSRSRSSVGERPPHTRKVAGSQPAGTTTKNPSSKMVFAGDGAHCAVAIQDYPANIRTNVSARSGG
jgi:hypothetical protein